MNNSHYNINDVLKFSLIVAIILISSAVFYYFVLFLPKQNDVSKIVDVPGNIIKCNELYQLKKAKYWYDGGISQVIYNPKLNTCLAMNTEKEYINRIRTGHTIIIDMANDKTLMYYNEDITDRIKTEGCKKVLVYFINFLRNGEEIREESCDNFKLLDKMRQLVRDYGFNDEKTMPNF